MKLLVYIFGAGACCVFALRLRLANKHADKKIAKHVDSPSASRYVVCGFRESCLHHATYNAALALGDEVHDILYLRTSGYLVLNLLDSVLESLVARVDDAVGICDVAEYALRHALLLEYDGRTP